MAAKFLPAVVLVVVAGVAPAQPDPEKLVIRTYDLKPVLGGASRQSGLADTDALIRLILQNVRVGELKPGGDGPQVVIRDGGKLEVRATEKAHGEIKDLLDALGRLADVAVDVRAEVVELDPAAFEKLRKVFPKPAKGNADSPVLFATGEEIEGKAPTAPGRKALEEATRILKTGRVVQTSAGRFANGAEATFSARQAILTYTNHPVAVPVAKAVNPLFVTEGFKLVGVPVVSADRRFVRFRLTEQSTAVAGTRKRALGELNGKPIVAESPEMEDRGATGSAVVADGGAALFRLRYAPKDRVWVVIVRPTVFIQAEEDELKEEQKK